ncbi:MAG TPA: DUF423 domain-containing protein [Bacillota bacterium]|nr:DUF423 domain-containing protein [Bacillota bacterium]
MKFFMLFGAMNGFLAVALGAFGAHGLEGKISEKALGAWEKAVTYQMFHTVALFVIGFLMAKMETVSIMWAGIFFSIGIVLFSGSLYVYATTGVKQLAMITPFGGVFFLIGWIILGYVIIRFV